MANVFPREVNLYARASLVIVGVVVVAVGTLAAVFYRSGAVTNVNIARAQPIPFSHQRHVGGNGIDCRYCHTSVENSAFAGIPPTQTCMTCHSQVLPESTLIQPIHESWNNEDPILWARVHDVPDFTYFNHSVHVAKGVGCTTCHGPIDEMPLTWKAETLHMAWCLECHRAPEKFVRPLDRIYDTDWDPASEPGWDQERDGALLVAENRIRVEQLTNCSMCHR